MHNNVSQFFYPTTYEISVLTLVRFSIHKYATAIRFIITREENCKLLSKYPPIMIVREEDRSVLKYASIDIVFATSRQSNRRVVRVDFQVACRLRY